MVLVDHMESRQKMVEFLLQINDWEILRTFVANQGLALIRIWFMLPEQNLKSMQIQNNIVKMLLKLPLTSRNQIDDTSIMFTLNQMKHFVSFYILYWKILNFFFL